jgi:membrane protein DedA with SNARE-associated domain
MDPAELLTSYGPKYFPWVVMSCALLENDITFVVAGIYAASVHPHLNPAWAIGAGVIGALGHDTFWFVLGHNGSTWLKGTSAWKRLGPQIEEWARRFGVRELFLCRFLPGTRNASVLFWGVQRLHPSLFYLIDTASLIIWATLMTLIGFKFGQQAEWFIGKVKHKHFGRFMLGALLLTVLVYYLVRVFTKHEIVKRGRPPEDPRAD